jgi:hypothetical protein
MIALRKKMRRALLWRLYDLLPVLKNLIKGDGTTLLGGAQAY